MGKDKAMTRNPLYYEDIRDLLGNIYDRSGVGLKMVPYSTLPDGTLSPGDPSTSGITMVRDVNYVNFFVCEIEFSNYYDLYKHSSDEGYTLLRSMQWLAGKDLEDKISEKKAFRVGAGDVAIYTGDFDQISTFDVRNYDSSVSVYSYDGRLTIKGFTYNEGSNSISVVVRTNQFAAPRERALLSFFKASTRTTAFAYVYVV